MALEWNKNGPGTLEVAGHEIFPELISHALLDTAPPPQPNQGRNFRAMMKKLELKVQDEKRAAEVAARKAAQQAIEEADEFYLADAEQYFSNPRLRAPLTTTSKSGVFSMPPELLTTVIDYLLNIDEQDRKERMTRLATLKSLRRAHPRFAYLRIIQRHLFHCLHLTPELDRLRHLDSLPQGIAPFVEKVKFWPWVVKRPVVPKGTSQISIARKVQKEMKPFVFRALNQDRTLKCWTRALQQLRHATFFEIVHCTSRGDRINCGPKGYFFMSLVFQSLVISQCTIHSLLIKQDITDSHVYCKVPQWELMDFAELRVLRLDLQRGQRSLKRSEYQEVYKPELHQVFSTAVSPVQTKLQELSIGTQCLEILQMYDHFALPMLRCLRIHGTRSSKIDAHWLARWIESLEKLQSFHLIRVQLQGRGLIEWKPMFDAIREHSQNIELRLEHIQMNLNAWLSLRHRVPDPPASGHNEGSIPSTMKNFATALAKYMSKLGDWKSGYPAYEEPQDRCDAENYDPHEDWSTVLPIR